MTKKVVTIMLIAFVQIMLVVLKATGVLVWAWGWVLVPLWIAGGWGIVTVILVALFFDPPSWYG